MLLSSCQNHLFQRKKDHLINKALKDLNQLEVDSPEEAPQEVALVVVEVPQEVAEAVALEEVEEETEAVEVHQEEEEADIDI